MTRLTAMNMLFGYIVVLGKNRQGKHYFVNVTIVVSNVIHHHSRIVLFPLCIPTKRSKAHNTEVNFLQALMMTIEWSFWKVLQTCCLRSLSKS